MPEKITLTVPLNRVEGDLEARVDIEDGTIADAWCSGTVYRGFERLLVGRGGLDGLVITPRICGICTTAHLTAAARALDAITGVDVPANGVLARNVALIAEHLQSDVRHTFLMFCPDLVRETYAERSLHAEALRRWRPLQGETVVEVLRETRKLTEVVTVIGGQWPHSTFMVPGGIAGVPGRPELQHCRHVLARWREWYERRVLGCGLERWLEVRSAADLDAWLAEKPAHAESELGLLVRYGRELDLERIGGGHGNFVGYGALPIPDGSAVRGRVGGGPLVPAGLARGTAVTPFRPEQVLEHVAHSWYRPYAGGRHPFEGETQPYASGAEGARYSWAKAPRCGDLPAETGPLAEMVLAKHPLFVDLVKLRGPSVLVRQLARLVRGTELIPAMETWLEEMRPGEPCYSPPGEIPDGEGAGLTHAARGALGHWVRIEGGSIAHYQVITPTAWNASPRDSAGLRGPMEEALVGTPIANPDDPVELAHVVRSFDPCLVCTVHVLERGRATGRTLEIGG